jgi:ribosomal protein L35AE/L33A
VIEVSKSDIGRRVVYDARPVLNQVMRGTIVGLDGRYVLVKFDHDTQGAGPLRVGSNLKWVEK